MHRPMNTELTAITAGPLSSSKEAFCSGVNGAGVDAMAAAGVISGEAEDEAHRGVDDVCTRIDKRKRRAGSPAFSDSSLG